MKVINLKVFKEFFDSGSVSGGILIFCVFVSLLLANTPIGSGFEELLSLELGFNTSILQLKYPLLLWINDGLMAVFFLLVGLEIKRELVEGELSSLKKAGLPIMAAIGGVAIPALIYLIFNHGTPAVVGWGIPMATDIAFALAIITLLGNRVPLSLKIFLAALAIVDDLIAILVIAIFYSADLHVSYLAYAGVVFAGMIMLNRLGAKHLAFYLIPGVLLWYFIHHSGIHATIAGVLTAITLPTTEDDIESPLERLEHALLKPVNLLIMPIFALANTNIRFEPGMIEGLFTPLGFGIVLGLVVGKPAGIFLVSWGSVKAGICSLPSGARWPHIVGVGMLGGIGFTMSIFITILSFVGHQHILSEAKFSVLIGSVFSGLLGYFLLAAYSKKIAAPD